MFGFLLTILVLNGLFLCVVILLQAGKGGGLAAMGGGGTAPGTENLGLGGRQASEFLVRATWAGGTLFLVLALVLSILSSRGFEGQPVLQTEPEAPSPLIPGAEDGAEEAPPADFPDAPPGEAEDVPPTEPPDPGGSGEGAGVP